jgi:Protein of unknown function (DUF1207)
MRSFFLFFLTLLMSVITSAQVKEEWFPDQLNIRPFVANILEPKAGFSFMSGKKLRLDISTSQDFYKKETGSTAFSIGGDLFTYTRLRAESDFHFPVEAIDYLFGINAGYKVLNKNDEYGFRLRLSHISAHFVDGKYDSQIQNWSAGDRPRVYSREFIEFMPYSRYKGFRIYGGLTYLFHVTPKNIGREIYQLGFDYYMNWLNTGIFVPYFAYDFKLNKIDVLAGNNSFTAGIKFGKTFGKGLSLAYSYFSGKSIQGEYYDRKESYSAIGINLDL